MTRTRRNRVRRRLVRAVIAGSLIAVGVGLGAFNDWWVALFFGIPLVFAGIAISPRASRVSELPEFRRATSPDAAQVEVEALTRSSLTADDLQPTMITATINPSNDTAYRARWITSMTKGNFQSLTDTPFTTLPPDALPPRDQADTPEFDDQPGRWALVYPAVTLVVAGALLFGVAGGWHVDGPSLSGFDSAIGSDDESSDEEDATSLVDQHRRMLDAIVEYVGPPGLRNVLQLNYQIDSPSASARVFDPATGGARSINIGDGYSNSSVVPNTERANKTFDAAAIDPDVLGSLAGQMTSAVRPFASDADLARVTIARPGPDEPALIRGTIDGGKEISRDFEVQARPDGAVAEFFDPADFQVAFDVARRAMAAAGIPVDTPVIDEFVIRGIADNTGGIDASAVQSSGGVLVDYTMPNRSGDVVVVPGLFPVVTDRPGRNRPDGFAFDATSPELFDAVRNDAMERGAIPDYDRGAVTIEMSDPPFFDEIPFAIRIDIANSDTAKGLYAPDGRFIKQGHY
ncbi:hypothetical protein [Gordonia lacunae]|uniref:Uncharacterized protein n=1 Tax=Gordonia lacunae TaxID=417102 RepID=A0A243Q7G7_9ACTN|nr:hypothetical protein [Gordonia lacunae]OUC77404.1 hypothetical protein CA982_17515 [Gordonia lacunae]